ncbi:MAG: hypothetical protein WCX47_01155 [Bacilli bacterium]
MNVVLEKINYPYADREFIANSFIIGNGRIGYKGTLEEEKALDKVTFNVVGVYDQYQSKWRESLNLFNPLYIALVNVKNKKIFHYKNAINHKLTLALNQGVFYRTSEFPELNIQSERFIHRKENLLISHYIVTIKSPIVLHLDCGIDQDIYEINGPHYRSIKLEKYNEMSNVEGITNEGHNVTVQLQQSVTINDQVIPIEIAKNHDYQFVQGDKIVITSFASVAIDDELRLDLTGLDYQKVKEEHIHLFQKRFSACRVMIENRAIQFAIDYSIYHLLILENEKYKTSIPARGLSGQVYKGAIFWDTEIFMLPFYLLTNPRFARNLIEYRINTLPGAKHKAKRFGYTGAFFAWESQEDGREQCSLFNVTDPSTNQPIRTYFADKQIHISIDVIYGLYNYLRYTDDFSILSAGGLDVIFEVYKFYQSRSTLVKGTYHFFDVVGPDEYHERIDDNAFTNYHIYFTFKDIIALIKNNKEKVNFQIDVQLDQILDFVEHIYLPLPDANKIIEQFTGYFQLEDIDVGTLKSRIVDPRAYLGGSMGIATATRIIKQADVVALFALHFHHFDLETITKNYEFYERYTEHGSSLSSSAYGLISARIGQLDLANEYFLKSATVDLCKEQKLYAGGIFIGGTHPASSGGAYNLIFSGFLGAEIQDNTLKFSPQIPASWGAIAINYWFKNKFYKKEFHV